jgi:hypothetical protein
MSQFESSPLRELTAPPLSEQARSHHRNVLLVSTLSALLAALHLAPSRLKLRGPRRFSMTTHSWADNLSGLWWGVGVLAESLAGGLLVLATRETQPEPDAMDAPLARETEREAERV